jgi:hypothetical protein
MQAGPLRTALENPQERRSETTADQTKKAPVLKRQGISRKAKDAALQNACLLAICVVSPRVFLQDPATPRPMLAKEKP